MPTNQKVTDLPQKTTVDTTDLFMLVDIPGGTESKSITGPNLRLYTDNTQSELGLISNPRTAAEIAAGVTPTNYEYESGDVRRYGVVGNGIVDDTASLSNSALASIRCYIDPSLQCRITGQINNLQSGQTWFGGGEIITDNNFNHHVFNLSGITDFTVNNIRGTSGTLGAAFSIAAARFFRAVAGSHRSKLLNCMVTGFQSAAQINASEHCQIIGNDISNSAGWGINVQTDAHDAIIARNKITGVTGEHGIYISGSSGNTVDRVHISNNHVSGCNVDGLKASYTQDSNIHNNHSYSNTGQGIYLTLGVLRNNVHDNTAYLNGENGVLVFDSLTNTDRNQIHNNIIYLNDRDGIRAQVSGSGSVTRTKIFDNEVNNNNQEAASFRGISLSGDTYSQIKRNTITNETSAINISATTSNTVISGNEFESNTTNISDSGTGTVIRQPTNGASSSIANGGTIIHGHVKTPTNIRVTGSISGEIISVTAISSTTFTVAIIQDDGTAGTSQTIYWEVNG